MIDVSKSGLPWVSVNDELPEPIDGVYQKVVALDEFGNWHRLIYWNTEKVWTWAHGLNEIFDRKVTHWFYIPKVKL